MFEGFHVFVESGGSLVEVVEHLPEVFGGGFVVEQGAGGAFALLKIGGDLVQSLAGLVDVGCGGFQFLEKVAQTALEEGVECIERTAYLAEQQGVTGELPQESFAVGNCVGESLQGLTAVGQVRAGSAELRCGSFQVFGQ